MPARKESRSSLGDKDEKDEIVEEDGDPGNNPTATAMLHAYSTGELDLTNLGLEVLPEEVLTQKHEAEGREVRLVELISSLKLSGNRLSNISDELCSFVALASLALDSNNIIGSLPQVVSQLTSLTRLSFQSNEIDQFPDISRLCQLKEIKANDNALKYLPASIRSLTSLEMLDISFNQIVVLPDEICDCKLLKVLRASGNLLKNLPKNIDSLKSMEDLRIDSNPLVRIPVSLALWPLNSITYDISYLQSPPPAITTKGKDFTFHYLRLLRNAETRRRLDLDEYELDSIPIEVCEIDSLLSLSLKSNKITLVAHSLTMLSRLEQLNLSYNKIQELPLFFTSFQRLQILDIRYNLIRSLPRNLGKCDALESILWEGNDILSPPPLILNRGHMAIMKYLQQLCDADETGKIALSSLGLVALPGEVVELTMVTQVNISSNSLTSLRPINLMTQLTSLNASNNRLCDIEVELNDLVLLVKLDLSNNRIRDVSGAIRKMAGLSSLDLSANPLQLIPQGLWTLTNLTHLQVEDCHLNFPPPEILVRGVKPILEFQRTVERGRYTRRIDLAGMGIRELSLPQDVWGDLVMINCDKNYLSHLPLQLNASTGLTELRVANNQLLDLPSYLDFFGALVLLDARDNVLQSLPSSLTLLSSLTRLRISRNKIEELPEALGSLVSLTELDADENALSRLPQSLCELNKLRTIRLSCNSLSELPLGVGRLVNLETLTLSDNKLTRIPLSFRNLSSLTHLNLADNEDLDLPPPPVVAQGIERIKQFLRGVHSTLRSQHLDLSGFSLSFIPSFVKGLTDLKSLDISRNSIESLEPIVSIASLLTSLDARENSLTALPVAVGGSPSLKELFLDPQIMEQAAAELSLSASRHVGRYLSLLMGGMRSERLDLSNLGLTSLPVTYFSSDLWSSFLHVLELSLENNLLRDVTVVSVLTNLQVLNLNRNQLDSLPAEFTGLTNLTSFSIQSNHFLQAPACLQLWTGLKELDLSHNKITVLPVQILQPLKELSQVDVSSNQLVEVRGPIWMLPKLKQLLVSENPIVSPPMTFVSRGKRAVMSYFASIESAHKNRKLDLSSTMLQAIPSEVFSVKSLTSLHFEDNSLTEVPSSISVLVNLSVLSFKNNQIVKVSEAISSLNSLRELELSDNQIAELPILSMVSLTNLSSLGLAANNLDSPPFELFLSTSLKKIKLADNPQLTSLPPHLLEAQEGEALVAFLRLEAMALVTGKMILSSQQLSSFPREAFRVPILTELNLSSNKIARIPESMEQLSLLSKLLLENNFLDELDPSLGLCVTLNEIRMAGNELTTLPDLARLSNLTFFDLSRNHFSSLPATLQYCTVLSHLNMSHNLLETLPEWICNMSSLKYLYVTHNRLTTIPIQMAELKRLKDFDFSDNDIDFPPAFIVESSWETVKLFLGKLQGAPSSKQVDLSGLKMQSFSCHTYIASFGLTHLNLSDTGLRHLREDVSRLLHLRLFDLRNNLMTSLPGSLGALKQLDTLLVDNNKLTELTAAISDCSSLTFLSLSKNNLTSLPPPLGILTSLKTLQVMDNQLVSPPDFYVRRRTLPWTLAYLRALDAAHDQGHLQLNGMSLSEIPSDCLQKTSVVKLSLNNNDIRDIAKSVSSLQALQVLALANNKLTQLPDSVCGLTTLQSLIIDDNMLKDLNTNIVQLGSLINLSFAHNMILMLPQELSALSRIKKLCADGNQMGEFPSVTMQMTTLQVLSLRKCGLVDVPPNITKLANLLEFNVADNLLDSLPSLSALSQLQILRLSNNRFQELPSTIPLLTQMKELSITGNMIQSLPPEFASLSKLDTLHLDGQNFDSIPKEIVRQGGRRVLDYMRRLNNAEMTRSIDLTNMNLAKVPTSVFLIPSLQHLVLSSNPVSILPPSISLLSSLRTLSVKDTQVRSLPLEMSHLLELNALELDEEKMVFPPADVCGKGTREVLLYLRKVANAAQLGKLDLSNCGMRDIPLQIAYLSGITALDLSKNRITRIPAEMALLVELETLDLQGNPLRPHLQDIVNRGVDALKRYLKCLHHALQTGKVDIVGQSLRFYPDDIQLEWNVNFLRLDDNQLQHLPSKLGTLVNLTCLSLCSNKLAELPDSTSKLINLQTVLLDLNGFSRPPACLFKLMRLKCLSITNNQLEGIDDEVGNLKNLEKLNVQMNSSLTHLPLSLGRLSKLEEILFDESTVNLPDAHFHGEKFFWYLKKLDESTRTHTLDLSNLKLSTMPAEVLLLSSLTVLSLARNKIEHLPEELGHRLSQLRMLDLESNKLKKLPDSIGYARHLTCLCALGNDIQLIPSSLGVVHDHGMLLELDPDKLISPPAEIFGKGMTFTLSYLLILERARESRQLSLNKWSLFSLPSEICWIPSLTDLTVDFNLLKRIPAEIELLTNLTSLSAQHNELEALPPELSAISTLRSLMVEENPFSLNFPTKAQRSKDIDSILGFLREVYMAKRQSSILDIGKLGIDELHLEGSTLSSLRNLRLDGSPRVNLENFLLTGSKVQLECLQEISMRESSISELPPFLTCLYNLKILCLDRNRFSSIPTPLCVQFPMLEELHMPYNQITSISEEVSLLTALRILNLGNNLLTSLSEVIGECVTALHDLHVGHNQISFLPANLTRIAGSLKLLDLESNLFTSLPSVVLSLTRLEELRLAGNDLSQLPLELGRLVYLKSLTVPMTDLGSVPKDVVEAGGAAVVRYICGVTDCESTGFLDYSSLNLRSIPSSLRLLLTSLTTLKLDNNPVKRLPSWLGEMQRLRRISLCQTPLVRLPATLGAISTLDEVVVDMDSATLLSPPQEVVRMGNLSIVSYLRRSYAAVLHHQLDLSGFRLAQFPFYAISSPASLTSITLNDNAISEVPGDISKLTSLVLLSMSNNNISQLPKHSFLLLSSLRSLNVAGNPLTVLPVTLGSLKKLEYLEYDGNSVVSPPRDILVKSVQSVVSYLKRAWEGRRTGMLDLSSLDLTEIPLEVTGWSPLIEEEGQGQEQPSVSAEEEASPAEEGAVMNVPEGEFPSAADAPVGNVYVIDDEVGRMEKLEMNEADVKDAALNQGEAADIDDALYVDTDVDRSFEQEDAEVVRAEDVKKMQETLLGQIQPMKEKEHGEEGEESSDELVASDDDSNPKELSDIFDLSNYTRDLMEDGVAFKTVVSINLERNKVTSLTPDIQRMLCLREISLCNNEIKSFPDSLSSLPNLIRIDASDNLLNSLPALMGGLCSSLKYLQLQNNRFTSLPGSLESLSSLVKLSMDGNMIEVVEIKSEFSLNDLENFQLNSNRVSSFEVCQNSMASLKVLGANHNLMQDWPDALMQCRGLKELHLDDNKLTHVSSSVGNLRRLKVLHMRKNELKSLPPELCRAKRLMTLDLLGNPLNEMAPICAPDHDIAAILTYLRAIYKSFRTSTANLSSLSPGSIPIQTFKFGHIHSLDISSNQLEFLSQHIKLLTALGSLNLKDNRLEEIPIELTFCRQLHTLHLDGNRFRQVVPNICVLKSLQVLTMSSNRLATITCEIANMVGLVMLDFRFNTSLSKVVEMYLNEDIQKLMIYLRTIQDGFIYGSINLSRRGLFHFPVEVLQAGEYITSLILSYNDIEEIPYDISSLSCLTVLDVSNNRVKELPEAVGLMTGLREVYLGSNNLRVLPSSFEKLVHLSALDVQFNPLDTFPFHLIDRWSSISTLNLDTERMVVLPDGATQSRSELVPLEISCQGQEQCLNYSHRLRQARMTGSLDVSVMQLAFVPNSIICLPQLTALNMTGNLLFLIPDAISGLHSLTEWSLNDNRLREIPASVCKLTRLRDLSVMDNKLLSIAPEVGLITTLRRLQLENNAKLKCPPVEVYSRGIQATLSYLRSIMQGISTGSIDLASSSLSSLELPFDRLAVKLRAMQLSNNLLDEIPQGMSSLSNLTVLWLDNNKLSSLPNNLGKMRVLQSLSLPCNSFTAMPACICDLPCLESLNMDENPMRFLHPRISELQSLRILSLRNNRLTMLPSSVAGLSSLRKLVLQGNPLAPLPPSLRDRQDVELEL